MDFDRFCRCLGELTGPIPANACHVLFDEVADLAQAPPGTAIFVHDPEKDRRYEIAVGPRPVRCPSSLALGLAAAFVVAADSHPFLSNLEGWERSALPWLLRAATRVTDGAVTRDTVLHCCALLRQSVRNTSAETLMGSLADRANHDRVFGRRMLKLALSHNGRAEIGDGLDGVICDLFQLTAADEAEVLEELVPDSALAE